MDAYTDTNAPTSRTGVCWSGLEGWPEYWPTARELAAQRAEVEAARETPRGRFLSLLNEMEHVYYAEVARARAAFARGMADDRRPADPVEVGEAIAALVGLNLPEAREAVACLAQLLLQRAA